MTLPADWQVSTQLSLSRVIGDTDTDGRSVFRGNKNHEGMTRFGQDVAYRMARFQLMAGYGYADKQVQYQEDSQGLSDASVALAHETEFASLSLRLYPFYRHVFPVGKSQGMPTDLNPGRSLDSAGVVGAWYGMNWDAQVTPEFHRNGEGENNGVTLAPSWGGSLGLGVGYLPSRSRWRYGSTLTARYEGAGRTSEGATARSQVWDLGLNLGRQLNAHHNVAASYLDQTLLGPARNTRLNRAVGMVWQARF